jgi:ubiquinone/menaquinone biosynthesis C-methylase UbiE
MNTHVSTPDFTAIKSKQQAMWASGDYAVIGTTLQIVGETLCEAAGLRAGDEVLDVAAGNGNATLAAARRYGRVTSTDYVPALLDRGRARAEAEGLAVTFRQADAEALPFPEECFDLVLSTFGVMFAPDQAMAAAEMSRVTRRGGRIGLANWTPDGFIGQVFKIIGRYVPPPAGVASPALWGTAERLAELFPNHRMAATTRHFAFRFHSPDHLVEVFRTWYGPMLRAFAALDPARQAALAVEISDLAARMNTGGDGTLLLPSAYLEAVLTTP